MDDEDPFPKPTVRKNNMISPCDISEGRRGSIIGHEPSNKSKDGGPLDLHLER